jgi:hypothetical protein
MILLGDKGFCNFNVILSFPMELGSNCQYLNIEHNRGRHENFIR